MAETPEAVRFEARHARRYRTNPAFVKTVIRIEVADPEARTVIKTRFGEQLMVGPFYAVAQADGSYGVAEAEFEASHQQTGDNTWVKHAEVDAYRATTPTVIQTVIDGHIETTVTAETGDWIVKQQGGEVMVVSPAEFAKRYIE